MLRFVVLSTLVAGALAASPAHAAENGAAKVAVPREARAASIAHPTTVIGNGTPRSCTSAKVVRAVRKGGVITFRCGPKPVAIAMNATAKVVNTSRKVVIDGGGKVTLDGRKKRRILYQNTCDQNQVWATSDCVGQRFPYLVVQNITLRNGWRAGRSGTDGGGAVYVRGGRFKAVNATFVANRCAATGADVGGGAVRVVLQSHRRPALVTNSTFRGGRCSNGGAISVLHASLRVFNSTFTKNVATGRGLNPARAGTPGGGSGGAIYADGTWLRVGLAGVTMTGNRARSGPGAVFFVSNDRAGTLRVHRSTLRSNPGHLNTRPGIFYLGKGAKPVVTRSIIR